jgi:hypothetical protein
MDKPAGDWRPVPGYEGLYEVSGLGQVWSTRRRGTPGGLLAPSVLEGYHVVSLHSRPRRKVQLHRVHALVLKAFEGPCPPGKQARHKNRVKLDDTRENLMWDAPHGGRPPGA